MREGPRGPLMLTVLLLVMSAMLLIGLPGCVKVNLVEESGKAPSMEAALLASPTPAAHDVAITAIDFDPPLTSSKAVDKDHVSLLAVVENKGNQTESRLMVQALLFGSAGNRALVESVTTVDKLVPGESKVVKFSGIPSLPVRSGYRLEVEVHPVAGESLVANNVKTYRVEVSLAPN